VNLAITLIENWPTRVDDPANRRRPTALVGSSEWGSVGGDRVAGGQLTVRTCPPLVPPLEQPRSPVVPPGVCTTTLKLPGVGIMEDVIVAVS
jgi:hypothetical protein